MAPNGWHIERDGPRLTLARKLPARFDLCAETRLGRAARGRIAHQVRQDLWRALQDVRGFSPVVEVSYEEEGLRVRAGGRVDASRFPKANVEARIAEVLSDPCKRRRWLSFAALKEQAS